MGRLVKLLSEHLMLACALAVALVVALMGGVGALLGTSRVPEVASAMGDVPEEGHEQESDPIQEAVVAEPAGFSSLRSRYSDDTAEIVDLLCASAWATADDANVLSFTPEVMVQSKDGHDELVAYVLPAEPLVRQETAQDGAQVVTRTFALETADSTSLVTMVTRTPDEGGPTIQVAGDAFASESPYLRVEGSGSVVLDAPDSEWLAQAGVDRDELEGSMGEWCAVHHPSATAATWTRTALDDYEARTLTLTYELDNRQRSRVAVVISHDDGSVTIEEGSSW